MGELAVGAADLAPLPEQPHDSATSQSSKPCIRLPGAWSSSSPAARLPSHR